MEFLPDEQAAAFGRFEAELSRSESEPVFLSGYLEAATVDDALDLFDLLMASRILSPARRAPMTQRLAEVPVGEGVHAVAGR